MPAADGSAAAVPVAGSWGTKISAAVGDLLALRAAHATAGAPGPPPKALVFSHWEDMLDLVGRALAQNGLRFERLRGRQRFEAALGRFKAEAEIACLLLPLKSGANGLNLVEAQHVFLLEPVLNAKLEAQAVGRVHRIGQTRPTTVHRYIVRDTVEARIYGLLRARRARGAAAAAAAGADGVADASEDDDDGNGDECDGGGGALAAAGAAARPRGAKSDVGALSMAQLQALLEE
jgi:hypothetical protein